MHLNAYERYTIHVNIKKTKLFRSQIIEIICALNNSTDFTMKIYLFKTMLFHIFCFALVYLCILFGWLWFQNNILLQVSMYPKLDLHVTKIKIL